MKILYRLSVFYVFINLASGLIHKLNHINNQFNINDVVVQIVNQCDNYNTVMIYNNFENNFISSLSKIDNASAIQFNTEQFYRNVQKNFNGINAFIMAAEPNEKIEDIFYLFKTSNYWNINSTIFILDKFNNGCNNANTILNCMWKMDLLQVYYVCLNPTDDITMLYTFNPYTNRAPQHWKIVDYSGKNKFWTLYKRKYDAENLCEELNFDRTKYLDNFTINIGIDNDHTSTAMLVEFYYRDVLSIIGQIINVTFINYTDNTAFYLNESVSFKQKLIHQLKNGIIDIGISFLPVDLIDSSCSILHDLNIHKYYIISNHRGYMAPLEKMYQFYGLIIIGFTAFILLITFFIIIWMNKNKSMSFATFELLRLITNVTLITPMNTFAKRFFFLVVLFYFLIIHATFHGNLSSFLTKPIEHKNIDQWDDVLYFDISKKYATDFEGTIYLDEDRVKQIQLLPEQDFGNDPSILNLSTIIIDSDLGIGRKWYKTWISFVSMMYKKHLYVSNEIHFYYIGVPIRHNWPLMQRTNIALMMLRESGLYNQLFSKKISKTYTDVERKVAYKTSPNNNIRPITLLSLEFAFYFLIFGTACSLLTFVCELFIVHKKDEFLQIIQIYVWQKIKKINVKKIFNIDKMRQINFRRIYNWKKWKKINIRKINIKSIAKRCNKS